MPAKRVSMRKLKEILRLKFQHHLSDRAIGRSCRISHRTVADYVNRFVDSGLSWPLAEGYDDTALQAKLYPEKSSATSAPGDRLPPKRPYLLFNWSHSSAGRSSFVASSSVKRVPPNGAARVRASRPF